MKIKKKCVVHLSMIWCFCLAGICLRSSRLPKQRRLLSARPQNPGIPMPMLFRWEQKKRVMVCRNRLFRCRFACLFFLFQGEDSENRCVKIVGFFMFLYLWLFLALFRHFKSVLANVVCSRRLHGSIMLMHLVLAYFFHGTPNIEKSFDSITPLLFYPGFDGKRCERLVSVAFIGKDSHVQVNSQSNLISRFTNKSHLSKSCIRYSCPPSVY